MPYSTTTQQALSPPPQAASPPSKRDLKSWWKTFKGQKPQEAPGTSTGFHVDTRSTKRLSISQIFSSSVGAPTAAVAPVPSLSVYLDDSFIGKYVRNV